MRIYTKTGDDGTTGLLGAGRFAKDHARIDAYGSVDELNAALGFARALMQPADGELASQLERAQRDLFVLGAALADPDPNGRFHSAVKPDQAEWLEHAIDEFEKELPPLTQFILPGGAPAAAWLHVARAICRGSERQTVHLQNREGEHVPAPIIVYLNRLSDYLFVLARVINARAGVAEVAWEGI